MQATLQDCWPTHTASTAEVRLDLVLQEPGARPALQLPTGSPKLTKVTASMAVLGHATLAGCPSGTFASQEVAA